jgi:hypothetical protein
MTLTLASTALVAVACGKTKTPTAAMSADLKRDLQLASTTQGLSINPDEISPSAKPEVALRAKRAPEGPKVVRTEKPTVMASAAPAEPAEIKSDVPQVTVMATAAGQSEAPAPDAAPPLARPAPIPAQTYPAGPGPSDGRDRGNGNGGVGGVWGGIFGGVMRGGIGDDDHCEPQGRTRRPIGGDIYGVGRPGGIGGIRPMVPATRPRGR